MRPPVLASVGVACLLLAALIAAWTTMRHPVAPPTPAPRPTEVTAATTMPREDAPLSRRDLVRTTLPATVSLRCRESVASGFFVEPDLVLTNAHALCPMGERIQVVTSDGRQLLGETARSNVAVDLALIRVPGAHERTLPLGDVGELALGDTVMIIGSPVGLEFTVHEGHVSNLSRAVKGVAYVQLDAKINPGNSGGPIIDDRGRVVGLVTLKEMGAEGIGLALPINYAYSREVSFANPPGAAAASSEAFKDMLGRASQNGGMQMPASEGMPLEGRPLLVGIDMDEYQRLVARLLRVQDEPPRFEEITVNVWSAAERFCTIKGDVSKWKEVDAGKAGSGVPDQMLLDLKKLGAQHIFVGEAPLAWNICDVNKMMYGNIELELVDGNPVSNRMFLRSYLR